MYKFLRKVDYVFVLFDMTANRGIVVSEDEMRELYLNDELENSEDYAYIETMRLFNDIDDIFTLSSVPAEEQIYIVAWVLKHQYADGRTTTNNYMILDMNTHETKEIDYATLVSYINNDKYNVLNASYIDGKVEFLPYSCMQCDVICETV